MRALNPFSRNAAAAFALFLGIFAVALVAGGKVVAQESALSEKDAQLSALFTQLADPELENWRQIESDIWELWGESGSSAMDFLLLRGRTALAAGDYTIAIDHLTALTDHAPDFAEGWNARATAYYHAKQYGPSVADIERTLALEPRHFGALVGLGAIFEELDYPKDALVAFRAALKVHPHRPDMINAIARLEKQVEGLEL